METKVNVVSNVEKELEVTLTYEEIQSDIEKAYNQERKKIELPGFRKGKAPMAMVKKMYGEAIEYGAAEKIAQDKFWEIAEEQNLEPISRPSITDLNLVKDKEFSFKVRFEVKPELELKNYKDQEIKKIVFTVDDETIEKEIENIQLSNRKLEDVESAEDKFAIVNVDIQKLDAEGGSPVEGTMSKGLDIALHEERVNPQIVEGAIGKKAGEKFSFSFHDHREVEENGEMKTLHEDFHYEATVNSVKKVVLPELDEELVKKLTKNRLSTAEELREDIRKGLTDYFERQSEGMFENNLLDMVVKNNDFEPPHGYVHYLLDRMVHYEEEKAKRNGQKNFDHKEAHNRLHNNAVWAAKWQLIMENIAKAENITVDDSELEKQAEEEAKQTGISADKMLKFYKDSNKKETLLEEKVIDFLKKNNNIKEVNAKDAQENTENL